DYSGEYQIIFGVNDSADPAVPLVQKLIAEFPARDIRLVICAEVFGNNRKVSNLIHLLREAKYEFVLVNDGDIHVSREYLSSVMSSFSSPDVGMVSCLYRGRPSDTLASELEALAISTDFAAGVLTAWFMEGGLRFGLGSTLAMGRSVLEKIGGFEAVVDYLADDYELGKRISDTGCKVELAPRIVETSIPSYSFRQFWEHQLRWARTMRISRPRGYRGLCLTYVLPWAILLVCVASHRGWAWALFAGAIAARIAIVIEIGSKVLKDRNVVSLLWLLPLRDFLALAIWFWSYAADTVIWRGEKFLLENGKMRTVVATEPQPADSRTGISH